MRTGIFGGTFDPVHIGHLIVVERVREESRLDRVLLIPCAVPPHKLEDRISAGEHRLEMVRLAVVGNDRLSVSETELLRGGVSYTVDTLKELHLHYPDDELFLIVGADNIREFHTWREPHRIAAMAMIIVATRPGYAPSFDESFPKDRIEFCEVPEIGVSSTDIRWRMREGKSCRYLLPEGVEQYARRHALYSERPQI